jgi:hypothetical protein
MREKHQHNVSVIMLFFMVTMLLSSCLDEVVFNTDIAKDRLNIQGQYTDDSTDQVVEIRKTANFEENSPNTGDPIRDAEVYVLENGIKRIDFNYTSGGLYKSFTKGKVGNSYQLIVKYKGEEYKSTTHIMQSNQKIDNVTAIGVIQPVVLSTGKVGIKNICEVNLNTSLFDGKKPINAFYRFSNTHQFADMPFMGVPKTCYVSDRSDLGKIIVLKGNDFVDYKVKDEKIFTVNHDYRFTYNYLLKVDQYSIDSTTTDYYSKLQELVKLDRSIFDPLLGTIFTNISASSPEKNPFGYFSVASKESYYILTNTLKLGFNAEFYCTPFNSQSRPRECENCLLFPASSTIKPSYWPI